MTRSEVLDKLRDILVQDFRVPQSSVQESASFRSDLKLDSLSLVDLIYLVQKDFGFKASIEEFRGTQTLGALVDLIVAKVASTSTSSSP